jgi:hypothetical protein
MYPLLFVERAEPLRRLSLGRYSLVLLGNLVQTGMVEYRYILMVTEGGSEQPCYFVTAEANGMAQLLGGGSHFLCAFQDGTHVNFGCSDDWADEEKFLRRAVELVRERFHLSHDVEVSEGGAGKGPRRGWDRPAALERPSAVKRPWWKFW